MPMDIPPLQPGPKWVTGASWWTSGKLFLPDDTMRCKRVAYIFFQQDAEPVISSVPAQGLRPWAWLVWMRAAWLADNAETHPAEPWLMIWMWHSVRANLFVVGGVFRTNVSRTWRRARCRGIFSLKGEWWNLWVRRGYRSNYECFKLKSWLRDRCHESAEPNWRAGIRVSRTLSPHRNFSNISAPSEIFQIIFTGTYENCVSPLTTFWIQGFSRV